ncbi:hypothetical protein GCM10022251_59030 [Phytohabitans flavus]|uniref:hypothetical protein n=1 Tax=Phytohabitans flavus TaxID=1076124 RepID=UPI0031F0BC5F
MAFDAARYDRDVITALRGAHGRLPAGDLWARYAMEPGLGSAQIAAHLSTVRAYWRRRASGPDSRAQVCRLLLAADEQLQRTAGEAMHDPAWWREQARPGTAAGRPEAPPTHRPGPPTPRKAPTSPPIEAQPLAERWRAEARDIVRAQLDRRIATRAPAPARGRTVRPRRAPEAEPSTPDTAVPTGVVELAIGLVSASGRHCRVRCSWLTVTGGEVRVRWSTESPPWSSGTVVGADEIERFGSELSGVAGLAGGRSTLEAELPAGYHVYVPFLIVDGRATVGRLVGHGVAEPVRQLEVEWLGDRAFLTWVWPEDATLAEVEWTSADGIAASHRISRTEYTEDYGLRLPVDRAGGVARVSAISLVAGAEVISPVRAVALDPRPARIGYTVARSSPRWRPRHFTVSIESDVDCPALDLVVVAAGRDRPETAEDGSVVGSFTALALTAGEPRVIEVVIPQEVHRQRPYWLRCFVTTDLPHTLTDPPVETMKVT